MSLLPSSDGEQLTSLLFASGHLYHISASILLYQLSTLIMLVLKNPICPSLSLSHQASPFSTYAVEPKHIAAALKSDPMIPLVAVEAATRSHAMLCLSKLEHQPQQHSQQPTDRSTALCGHHPPVNVSETQQYKCEGVRNLVPFVSKISEAVVDVLQSSAPAAQPAKQPSEECSALETHVALSIKVFSLLLTSCKIGLVAAEPTACVNSQTSCSDSSDACVSALIAQTAALHDDATSHWYDKSMLAVANTITTLLSTTVINGGTHLDQSSINSLSSADQAVIDDVVHCNSTVPLIDGLALNDCISLHVVLIFRMLQACVHRLQSCLVFVANFKRIENVEHLITSQAGSHLMLVYIRAVTDVMGCLRTIMGMLLSLSHVLQHAPISDPAQLEALHCLRQHTHDAIKDLDFDLELDPDASGWCFSEQHDAFWVGASSIPTPHSDSWEELGAFLCELQAVTTESLAGLPIMFCCNNPDCLSLDRLSEFQLVSSKACVCGGCELARYCSRQCQKKHWKQHRVLCRANHSTDGPVLLDESDEFSSVVSDEWFECLSN